MDGTTSVERPNQDNADTATDPTVARYANQTQPSRCPSASEGEISEGEITEEPCPYPRGGAESGTHVDRVISRGESHLGDTADTPRRRSDHSDSSDSDSSSDSSSSSSSECSSSTSGTSSASCLSGRSDEASDRISRATLTPQLASQGVRSRSVTPRADSASRYRVPRPNGEPQQCDLDRERHFLGNRDDPGMRSPAPSLSPAGSARMRESDDSMSSSGEIDLLNEPKSPLRERDGYRNRERRDSDNGDADMVRESGARSDNGPSLTDRHGGPAVTRGGSVNDRPLGEGRLANRGVVQCHGMTLAERTRSSGGHEDCRNENQDLSRGRELKRTHDPSRHSDSGSEYDGPYSQRHQYHHSKRRRRSSFDRLDYDYTSRSDHQRQNNRWMFVRRWDEDWIDQDPPDHVLRKAQERRARRERREKRREKGGDNGTKERERRRAFGPSGHGRVDQDPSNPRWNRQPRNRGTEEARLASKRLYVGNLPPSLKATSLESLFGQFGTVLKITMPPDRLGRAQNRGFAFVEFEERRVAEVAMREFWENEIGGNRIRLDWDVGSGPK